MASISSSSLSFSFAPIDARPHKRQKTQQRFELTDLGFKENTLSEVFYHKAPFAFEKELYCTVGGHVHSITLVGRVALFDALPCLKILEKQLPDGCNALPLQYEHDPYSAFHWALQAPGDTVSEYFLENGPHPLACTYGKNLSICDTCLPKAIHLVEKTQRHIEITKSVRSKLLKLQRYLSIRLARYLPTAWKSKDLTLIGLCLKKGIACNRNMMGKMLLQGIAEGFDAGVVLLLRKDRSLATYSTPDTGSAIWGITALHVAAAMARNDLFSLLMLYGADPQARTLTRNMGRPRETFLEYGLRERTDRGFSNLVNYANNFCTANKEHWDVFGEMDRDALSRLLALFIKSYSLFSSGFGPPRMQGECQKTEEAIMFLLLMGADPGVPDKKGFCSIDWIRNCRYLVRIDPTPFFTEEYVDRIIAKMVAHSSTVHPLLLLIAEYAAIQKVSAISIIWNTSSQQDDRLQVLQPA